jgi:hypothetical protein
MNGVTVEEYLAEINRLNLRPSNVSEVYLDSSGGVHNVPDPRRYTFEQRPEILDQVKRAMGIFPQSD